MDDRLDVIDDRVRLLEDGRGSSASAGLSGIHIRITKHDQAEPGADQIGQPPAEIRRQQFGIEQHDGGDRADRRPDPEAAVDHRDRSSRDSVPAPVPGSSS